jgi:putative transposase
MRARRTFRLDRVGKDPGAPPPAGKERCDRLGVVTDEAARTELTMSLDELAREGARRMLAVALEAEVDVYLAALAELVDEHGHRLMRRNGHAPARQLATGAGQVEVVRPRVDDCRVGSSRQPYRATIAASRPWAQH